LEAEREPTVPLVEVEPESSRLAPEARVWLTNSAIAGRVGTTDVHNGDEVDRRQPTRGPSFESVVVTVGVIDHKLDVAVLRRRWTKRTLKIIEEDTSAKQ
jgi:hypothetical protein